MQPGKRKLSGAAARAVRVRQPAYFLPELAHVVAAADERVPFVNLAQEVNTDCLAQADHCGDNERNPIDPLKLN